jgi:nitroreductase
VTDQGDPAGDNETLATIARRRSVRVFDGRPVSPSLVEKLIEAANQAPSAHNSQSWRFIVLGPETKRELAALVSARSATSRGRPTCCCAWRRVRSAPRPS